MKFNPETFRNKILEMIDDRKLEQDYTPYTTESAPVLTTVARELSLLRGLVHAVDAATEET